MPVKGLSERKRVPRVGKIHLGIRDEKKGFPKAVDYFVVSEDQSTSAEAAKAFHEVYGEKPTELDVVFLTDDIDDWADPWRKSYSNSWGLLCRGDGEEAWAMWDEAAEGPRPPELEKGTWATADTVAWHKQKIPCHGPECPLTIAGKCKTVMNLQFMLPKVRGIGVWQIDTGSRNSIENVRNGAQMIMAFRNRIRGIPLKLRLVKKEVTPPDGKKKKTVWVMKLSKDGVTPEQFLGEVSLLPADRLMLPEPVDDGEMPEDLFELDAAETEPVVVVHGDLPTESVEVAEATVAAVAEHVVYNSDGELAFKTLGEFLTSCLRELGLNKTQVEAKLGPVALMITQDDRLKAWATLQEAGKKREQQDD